LSKKVITTAHVEGGQLIIHHRGKFTDGCAAFRGRIRITAEKETRSIAQNGLLWLYNTIVSNELGWNQPEDVHEYTKSKINLHHRTFIDKKTGEIIDESFPGPTHTMVKDQMTEFLEKYRIFWAEKGIWLPSTEEEFYDWENKKHERKDSH